MNHETVVPTWETYLMLTNKKSHEDISIKVEHPDEGTYLKSEESYSRPSDGPNYFEATKGDLFETEVTPDKDSHDHEHVDDESCLPSEVSYSRWIDGPNFGVKKGDSFETEVTPDKLSHDDRRVKYEPPDESCLPGERNYLEPAHGPNYFGVPNHESNGLGCIIIKPEFTEKSDYSTDQDNLGLLKDVRVALTRLTYREIVLHYNGFNPTEYKEKRRLTWYCPFCDYESSAVCTVSRHAERRHSRKRTIACKLCGKLFFFTYELYGHHRRIHANEGFNCRYCDRVLKSKNGRQIHEAIHTGDKNLECSYCDKRFSSSYALTVHIRYHINDRPYHCRYCSSVFHSYSGLRNHERCHTSEQPYKCSFCPKKFSLNVNRKAHERRLHTGERPFSCPYCTCKFYTKSDYNNHKWLHLPGDQAPYQCETCELGFARRDTMNIHFKRCKGKRPFKCETCNQSFNHEKFLVTHKEIHQH